MLAIRMEFAKMVTTRPRFSINIIASCSLK
jgi:hypothetical protein